ncbi:MAG: glycosyltransferase family 39 protein [Nitrospinae bacterium]|nr:glycosyltransferase family 39 protein [Nitrospinota bacterium]
MPNFSAFSSTKSVEKYIVLLWMVFCFLVLIYKLGEVPPYHADENFYVESSLRMVESGDYITPVYHGKKRFAKPILYYWMVASSYKIFGVSLSSARLPSVLFGTLSVGLVFLLGCRLFDSRVGLFSAFILPSIYLHFQISRWSTTDMALSFFVLLSIYFFVLLYKTDYKRKLFAYLFYFSLGLGFMVKGPPAVIIPGLTVMGYLMVTRKKNGFKDLYVFQGLIILAIIILPWFFAMFWMHGDEFKDHIVGNEIKNRLVHSTPFSFYYPGVFFRYQLPWSIFFIFAALNQFGFFELSIRNTIGFIERLKELGRNIVRHIKALFNEENFSLAICYLWIGVCLVLFTLLRVQHSRYMLPCCPAIALLTAKMFADAERNSSKSKIFGFNFSVFLTVFMFLGFSILAGLGLFVLGSDYLAVYILPLVLMVGAFTLIGFHRFKVFGKVAPLIALVLSLSFASSSGDVIPYINRYPMKKFANHINQENIKGPIAIYKLGSHRARLGVLTGRTVMTLNSPGEMEEFLKANQEAYLVIKQGDWEKKFSDSQMKIVLKDQIGIKNRIQPMEIKEFFNLEELGKVLNSTETLYFMKSG